MSSAATDVRAAGTACWICRSTRVVRWRRPALARQLVPDDLKVSDRGYGRTLALWRCEACRFIFADGEGLERLTALYERMEDRAYEASQVPRARQMRWLLDAARRARPAARRVLDVGAGVGGLVAVARAAGLDAVGVEPSRAFVDGARRIHGVELLHGLLPHPGLHERRFDLVFLVDVLEHVIDPVSLLRRCADVLEAGGLVVVVTPDVGSVAARVLGRRWWHCRLAHVGYFDATSLARAAAEASLVVTRRSRAMWFFEVGYLAERLERYVPIAAVNRLARRLPVLGRLHDRTVRLNLRDSFLALLEPDGRPTPG